MRNDHHLTSEQLLADLQSPDETIRAKAIHAACPCEAGMELFEKHIDLLAGMKKDPSPLVRTVALHVFQDAFEGICDSFPTSRAETTNEILRTRRQSRFKREEVETTENKPLLENKRRVRRLRNQR
ncbi:hypothetical protein CCAX7_006860 [Capsulimonas corticalis]|uniref:Uncharacterized protein n=2 Tax=Capsulimonas corticalis TaxID=2219043 RepID=A0A402D1H3_9BACT|nr:hypothetical protein CCAX7_006860 [Capsulimonas corticalis]